MNRLDWHACVCLSHDKTKTKNATLDGTVVRFTSRKPQEVEAESHARRRKNAGEKLPFSRPLVSDSSGPRSNSPMSRILAARPSRRAAWRKFVVLCLLKLFIVFMFDSWLVLFRPPGASCGATGHARGGRRGGLQEEWLPRLFEGSQGLCPKCPRGSPGCVGRGVNFKQPFRRRRGVCGAWWVRRGLRRRWAHWGAQDVRAH